MKKLVDHNGKPITRKDINRSMQLSLIAGGLAGIWFLFTSPQQILTLFIKNELGASSAELGLFLGLLNFVSIFHLVAIVIYTKRSSIKPVWIAMGFIHRTLAFLVSGAAFYAARGGDKKICLYLVMASSLLTFILGNTAGSGWWTWINELVPPSIRSSYFGKRSSLAQALNIVGFFTATILLDYFSGKAFYVFGFIYLAAGILGVTDIFLHLFVPEPVSAQADRSTFKAALFFKPMRNKNFLTFCIVAGVSLLGVNLSAPFFVPMITSPQQIGAPNIWLGLMFIISQLTWVIMIPFWGTMMDRFGRKPVAMIGLIFPLSYLGYLFLTPQNFSIVLPIIAFTGGIFSPALYEGLNQAMLTLIPNKDRTVYIAWYWALLGSIQAFGPIVGGIILQKTGSIDLLIFCTMGITVISFILLETVKTGKELKFTRLISTITSPGIIKSYINIPVIGKSQNPEKVGRALQNVKDTQGSLALEEILIRMDDTEEDIREEAVKALGRIGGNDAVQILLKHLKDSDSLVRVECARALGKLRAAEAVPYLIEALSDSDTQLIEASARALGKIDTPETSKALMKLIEENSSLRIRAAGVSAISDKQERVEVLREILQLRDQTTNIVIKKQLTIAVGNILGIPGEFYQFLTGTESAREEAVQKLFKDIKKNLKTLKKTEKGYLDRIVLDALPKSIQSFENGDYADTYSKLKLILENLIKRHFELQHNKEESHEDPLLRLSKEATRLFAGYTVLLWFEETYKGDLSKITEAEILLLFYFLKYYGKKNLDILSVVPS